MKIQYLKSVLIGLFIIGWMSPQFNHLHAQDDKNKQNPIVSFSYMKSKNQDYQKMEKEIWQPYLQQAIKDGKLEWWGIYAVEFPFGTSVDYDYVAINIYSSMEQLENAWNDVPARMKKVHPNKDLEKIMKRTEASRDLVWGEVFTRIGYAVEWDGDPAKFIAVNRMQSNPGKYNDYIRMELEIFQPAHKMSAKKNLRKNWHFLQRTLPYGAEYGYDFMTFDSYESLTQMSKVTPANVWQDAHPDKDIEEIWEELNPAKMRTVVRGEVWKNILFEKNKDAVVADTKED